MKKVLKILCVAMVICLGVSLSACGKTIAEPQTTENVTNSFTQTSERESHTETTMATENYYEEEMAETHYYHSAIEGCVIVEQDGTPTLYYSEKCENCGYVSNSKHMINHSFGAYTSSFHCPDCGNNQHVEFETSQY